MTGIRRNLSATYVYSCTLLIFHIDTLRRLTTFDDRNTFGTCLFLKISYCVWSLEYAGQYVSMLPVSLLVNVITDYQNYLLNGIRHGRLLAKHEYINRFTIVYAVILGILDFANTAFTTYLIFWTTLQDVILAPWNREYEYVADIQITNMIHCIYLSFAWFSPSVLMFMIWKIITYEFIQNLIKNISSDDILY